jgi:hypothetical protein
MRGGLGSKWSLKVNKPSDIRRSSPPLLQMVEGGLFACTNKISEWRCILKWVEKR